MPTFDAYHKWLGISPKDQPPHHYRLLGIELFEADVEVIDVAANKQMRALKEYANGEHADASQRLLNEVAAARLCLLNAASKTRYDQALKAKGAAGSPLTDAPRQEEHRPRSTAVPAERAASQAESGFPVIPEASRLNVRSKKRSRVPGIGAAILVVCVLISGVAWRYSVEMKAGQSDVRPGAKPGLKAERETDGPVVAAKPSVPKTGGKLRRSETNEPSDPPERTLSGEKPSEVPLIEPEPDESGGRIADLMVQNLKQADSGPSPAATPASGKIQQSSPDVKSFGGKRFKVVAEPLSWHEAHGKCQEAGGRLAEVRSKAENEFLVELAKPSGVDGVWLGATDEVQEGRWLWSDGTELTFKNWSSTGKQPNNGDGREHYLMLMAKQYAGKWADQPAVTEWKAGYVCEWSGESGGGSKSTDVATNPASANQASRDKAGESDADHKVSAKEAFELRRHDDAVLRLTFHPLQPLLCSSGKDGRVLLWNLTTRTFVEVGKFREWVMAAKFNPAGALLAFGNWNGRGGAVFIKEVASLKQTKVLGDFKGGVTSVAFSPDALLMVVGQDNGTIRLWETKSYLEAPPQPLGSCVHALAFGLIDRDPRKKLREYVLAAGGTDGSIKTFRAAFVQEKKTTQFEFTQTIVRFETQKFTTHLRFSPDGLLLGTTHQGGTIALWNPETGALVRELRADTGNVEFISFHPNRPWIVTAHSRDRCARVWNIETGKVLCELRGHTGEVFCAEFSHDGRQIATASADFSVKVWDLEGPGLSQKGAKSKKLVAPKVGD